MSPALAATRRARGVVATIASVMAHLAGWNYVACSLFITFDVVARKFFGFSSQATIEITGYMLAGGIAWALAHTLMRRAHIRVDVLANRFPVRIRAWLHLAALTLLAAFGAFTLWAAWDLVDESTLFDAHDNSALHIPLVLPQGLWAFGITAFMVAVVVLLLESALALAAGQGATLDALLGSRTIDDETEEALEAVQMAREGSTHPMIAIVFLLVLLAVTLVAAATTGQAVPVAEILSLVGVFLVFFGTGVYIAAVLGILGILIGLAFSTRPWWSFAGETLWTPSSNFVLVAVPLFLLMGEILLRAGLSDRLYRSLNVWLNRLPGGLLHTNIAACAVFSAISGSSVATAATMGSVALPYFSDSKYSQRMVLGSLAAGGALGNLIPPGITFIIYGLITETSVGALYIAAILPSLLVTGLFILVILAHGLTHPMERPPSLPLREKLRSLTGLIPTLLLMLLVLGSIYAGYATPTEAAALGVVGSAAFAAIEGKLTWRLLNASAEATARNTALLGLIIFGAYLLNYLLTTINVPQALAGLIAGLPLPPWAIMLAIVGLYVALGTFMEGFSMIITTVPVVFPIVTALGYDPIWFGVIVTMLVEIAQISPPDGTVMYVLQGMRPRPGPITDVFAGVMPFLGVYLLAVLLLMLFPGIALWLPRLMQ